VYAAISFVAGEQPTTAKWNLIGSNFADIYNGTYGWSNAIPGAALVDGGVTSRKLAMTAGINVLASAVGLAGNNVPYDIVFSDTFTPALDAIADVQCTLTFGGIGGTSTNISMQLYSQTDASPTWVREDNNSTFVTMGVGAPPEQRSLRIKKSVLGGHSYRFKALVWSSNGVGNVVDGSASFIEWELKRIA
jgi:hypothetical protein